jgi:hypothetical protein
MDWESGGGSMVRAKGMGNRVKKRSACTNSANGRRRDGVAVLGGRLSVTSVGGGMKVDVLSVDAWTIHAPKATSMSHIFEILQGISKA